MAQLQRRLTLTGLTLIAVGSSIGSGIFVSPYEVAQAVPHHGYALLVWVLGGLVALTGALTFAELGGMFPQAGGVYVFLKEAYGRLAGFLYGWIILLVINTGALAALGIALAEYLTYFFPLSPAAKVGVAIAVIAGLTAINVTGVGVSQAFAGLFTTLKLVAIGGIILAGIFFYHPGKTGIEFSLHQGVPDNLIGGMLVGLIGALWSFGGWHHASYLAGETIDAQRTVPRAMVLGAAIVTLSYVLINLAYMLLLPLPEIAGTRRVAGDAIASVIPYGGQLVAVAIAISIFGTISIYTMSAPRIYFAMARDGVFFSQLAYIHPRFQTPVYAMVGQAVWAIILLLFWGAFSELITYVTFMDIFFMGLAGAGVFVFRIRRPQAERSYRVALYPWLTLIFVLISAAFVVNTLIQRPAQALAGMAVMGLGIVVFYAFRKREL